MTALLLTLCTLIAALPRHEVPAQDPTLDPNEGWVLVNGVAIQAGGRLVTLAELDESLRREANQRNIPRSDPRYGQLARRLVQDLSQYQLEPEAGEDLGVEPERIEALVDRSMRDQRRSMGSAGLADALDEEGRSLRDLRDAREAQTYRDLWRLTITGGEGLPDRPRRDSFIRPGELRALYRENRDALEPDLIQLQLLGAPTAAYGDEEKGRAYLEGIRQRALDGEDFGTLVEEHGSLEIARNGLMDPRPVVDLVEPLRSFAEDASTGDVGPVVQMDFGEPVLLIPYAYEKVDNEPPSFGDPTVQADLRERFAFKRRTDLLTLGRSRLLRQAFLWVTPRLDGLRAPAGAPPEGR